MEEYNGNQFGSGEPPKDPNTENHKTDEEVYHSYRQPDNRPNPTEENQNYGEYRFGGQPGAPYQAPPPAGEQWRFNSYEPMPGTPKRKKKKQGIKIFAGVLGVIMGLVVLTFAAYGLYNLIDFKDNAAPPTSSSAQGDTPKTNDSTPELSANSKPLDNTSTASVDGILSTPQIYKKAAPSVVGIIQYQSSYFEPTGEGSGIILSSNGYIATNAHVIDGADTIEVVLKDGTTYKGSVVGVDTKTDLAVIKIDATGLTPAELGSSAELVEGEKVIAIGNPGGLSYAGSISQGVVSGLNRSLRASTDGYTLDFIQTDAAINPGNSGGALVNEFGQVVGINSQKISAEGYEGIGFAIPVDEAMPILSDLMSYGHVTGRVKLGISAYAINEYAASVNGIPAGILISSIDNDSSLKSAGVQEGDLITLVDGTPVNSFTGLNDLLRGYKPGDTVTLTIFRANYTSSGSSRFGFGGGGQTVTGTTFEVQVTLIEDAGTTK